MLHGLLAVLTDEEVEAAGGRSDLVPLPHLWSLPPPERASAVATAGRSLRARGVLDSRTAAPVPGGLLAGLFDLRHHPSAVLACTRTADASPMRARYVFKAGGELLVEDLDETGVHRWRHLPADRLGDDLASFLVPPGARDGHGKLTVVTDPCHPAPAPAAPGETAGTGTLDALGCRDPAADQLGSDPSAHPRAGPGTAGDVLSSAVVTADLIIRSAGDGVDERHPPPLHGLFLGPRGTYRTRSTPGEYGPVVLHGMAVADVGVWAAGLLEIVSAGHGAEGAAR